jgi:dipeptidyl aminopeptidase/acylaminoacyl peptidase
VETTILSEPHSLYTALSWSPDKSRLAFVFSRNGGEKAGTASPGLWIWDGAAKNLLPAVPREKIPAGWMIPADNRLRWTRDSQRLFLGFKPYDQPLQTPGSQKKPARDDEPADPYDIPRILQERGVTVWRWDDPLIAPRLEKVRQKLYLAVYHFDRKLLVPLADKRVTRVEMAENPHAALGFSEEPYLREFSWNHRRRDVYVADLDSGFRVKLLTGHRRSDPVSLSPGGRFVAYYSQGHWFLYDVRKKQTRRLTGAIAVPFSDPDHDLPDRAPAFPSAGWTENGRSVIIYDKYDIWEFFTRPRGKDFICLTQGKGRETGTVFRIQPINPDALFFKKHEKCLLTAYSETNKSTCFYTLTMGKAGARPLTADCQGATHRFLQKAANADKIIYTRENHDEFPDIHVAGLDFLSLTGGEKVSALQEQLENVLWSRCELLEWKTADGVSLQGLVVKPGDFTPGKRYPVLVYCYERFSHQLHRFPYVGVNNSPCLPYYAGEGYVIFLPDIRFKTGAPGQSAVDCIVPGVRKLIETGIADPGAIGIYGHSWGGYLASFVITRTRMFAAAAVGAPAVNLTSAYNAVRWRGGAPRQFHYEKSQGRMGKPLWEIPELYIRNSPLFSAPAIETPLLIEAGDNDGVVPWSQAVELYLALRRLGKKCILLQYNEESHHLKKYANKLDYTIKLKEFLDCYLMKKKAPFWIVSDGQGGGFLNY